MKIQRVLNLSAVAAVVCCFFLSLSCTDNPASDSMGKILIRLIDSPGLFDQEVIVMRRIEIHRTNFPSDLGWRVINGDVSTYDVLKLRNGVTQVIASTSIPVGTYDALRITLEGSNVWVGGQYRLLTLPTGVAGGFVLQHSMTILEGDFYELVLDFDAFRSVTRTGPTQYTLNPFIRAQDAYLAGSISGSVVTADSSKILNSWITTSVGSDQATTGTDLTNGSFLLGAMPEGTYDLRVFPADSLAPYQDTTLTGITIVRQRETKIGTIQLRHR
jgi:hypothetical protein